VAPDGGDVLPDDDEVTPTGQDDVPREIAVARMPRISVSPPEHGDAKDARKRMGSAAGVDDKSPDDKSPPHKKGRIGEYGWVIGMGIGLIVASKAKY
jgi:hypothetical protein